MEMIKEAGVMFGEAAAGAILGPACEGVLESIKKCCMFDSPVLASVKSTVEHLESLIPQMEGHNMNLAGRQDELKELKEQMECGRKLLDELSEVNDLSCFKASYNEKLAALDDSLKNLVRKLRLQLATDVKEVLVLEKETARVVKENKRKLYQVDETVKAGFSDIQKRAERQDDMLQQMMKKLERKDLASQGGAWLEASATVAALAELDYSAPKIIIFGRKWTTALSKAAEQSRQILNLLENTTAEIKERSYIPVGELKDFRMSIEDGVDLLRNCPKDLEWTDELEYEYSNKFLALGKTLEALYNRLAGIRPLKWKCGKCAESCATTSTSIQDSARFCH